MSRPREKTCPQCGGTFTAMNDRKRFCCEDCRNKWNHERRKTDGTYEERRLRGYRSTGAAMVNKDAKVDSYLCAKPSVRRYWFDTW